VTDRASFRPVATGVALIEAFRQADPRAFAWRQPPYEYETVKPPIDMLYGSSRLREALDGSGRAADLVAAWPDALRDFLAIRARFLLY
jgi:uncharacterized protein YbbC (DUF1343 family)